MKSKRTNGRYQMDTVSQRDPLTPFFYSFFYNGTWCYDEDSLRIQKTGIVEQTILSLLYDVLFGHEDDKHRLTQRQ